MKCRGDNKIMKNYLMFPLDKTSILFYLFTYILTFTFFNLLDMDYVILYMISLIYKLSATKAFIHTKLLEENREKIVLRVIKLCTLFVN